MVGYRLCQALEYDFLNVEVFISCLNDKVCIGQCIEFIRVLDSVDHISRLSLSQAILGNLLRTPVLNEGA